MGSRESRSGVVDAESRGSVRINEGELERWLYLVSGRGRVSQ
jgi:hypothetical protein